MISLNNNNNELPPSNQEDLKNLVNQTIEKFGAYSTGSTHGGLSPTNIQDIIAFIMYSEDCRYLNITIGKSEDDYHLNLSVNEKH